MAGEKINRRIKAVECKNCRLVMKEVNRKQVINELDEDSTDGQMADYLAAELSGDTAEWESTEVTYECEKCGHIQYVMEI